MSDPVIARCKMGHTAYVDEDGDVWMVTPRGAMLADVEPETCPRCGSPLKCDIDENTPAVH
jgi:hypothetical protein